MMKKILIPAAIAMMAFTAACATDENKAPMVGNDRDAHGCIGSAGYTWSNSKNECVQIWIAGKAMTPADPTKSSMNYYVIINGDDQPVEIFLPKVRGVMLEGNVPEWKNDKYSFTIAGTTITLKDNAGNVISSGTLEK